MKLPLLFSLLLMGGCNCDLDSCSFSSDSASQSTYQEPHRQASAEVDLSGYGGMYSGVRIPAKPQSQQTETAIPSTAYQATTDDPKLSGFVSPPILKGGCQTGGAAEYAPDTNTIHLCIPLAPAQERYAIAHEMAHAVDFQEDAEFEADAEYWADQKAVNSLLQKSDCEAVESRAVSPTETKNAYTKGILYAREMYSIHCK